MCPVTSAKRWCTNCHLLHRWKQTAPFSEALKNRVRTRTKSWHQTAPFSEALKNRVQTRAKSWRQSDPAGSVGAGFCWMKRLRTPTLKTLGIVNPATKRSPKTYFLQQHFGKPKFAHYIPPSRNLSRMELFIKGIDGALRAIGPVAPRSASHRSRSLDLRISNRRRSRRQRANRFQTEGGALTRGFHTARGAQQVQQAQQPQEAQQASVAS